MPAERKVKRDWRERLRHPVVWVGLILCSLVGAMVWLGTGCGGWDPREPLMRNAPEVDEAIALMDAGDYTQAAQVLQNYLGTGKCQDGEIGVPTAVRERPDGTFDLGLVLFHLAEKYGGRFGEEDLPPDGAMKPAEIDPQRISAIDCARSVVNAIASDTTVAAELRARAYFLAGNLEVLRREYQAAVDSYDLALQLIPGIAVDADGDAIGRDAAWNRAIALRRLQDNDAGQPDAEPDAEPDGGGEGDQGDGGGEDQQNQDQNGEQDGGADGGDAEQQDGGGEEQDPPKPEPGQEEQAEAGDPKEEMGPIAPSGEEDPEQSRMRMILEELEDAPTYQQEEAKNQRGGRRVLEDK